MKKHPLDMYLDEVLKYSPDDLENPKDGVKILLALRLHERNIEDYYMREYRKISSLFDPNSPQAIWQQIGHEIYNVKIHIGEMSKLIGRFESLPEEEKEKAKEYIKQKIQAYVK